MGSWWVEAGVGVFVLILAQFMTKRVIKLIQTKEKGVQGVWKNQLGEIVGPPVALVLWTVGVVYVLDVASKELHLTTLIDYLYILRKAIVVSAIGWFLLRWKNAAYHAFAADKLKKLDLTTAHMLSRLATVVISVLSVLVVLQVCGVNTAPLLAFGSIGAASLGFAGKDVIANFCSGLLLHIVRPFVIGDYIALPEKNLEGYVEEIGWFKTSMRDKEKRAVYLPNNFFSTFLLVNVSRRTHRRLLQSFHIPFEHAGKIPELVVAIREVIQKHPKIDCSERCHVHLSALVEGSCQIDIDAYTVNVSEEEFAALEEEVLLIVQNKLAFYNVNLAGAFLTIKQLREG